MEQDLRAAIYSVFLTINSDFTLQVVPLRKS